MKDISTKSQALVETAIVYKYFTPSEWVKMSICLTEASKNGILSEQEVFNILTKFPSAFL